MDYRTITMLYLAARARLKALLPDGEAALTPPLPDLCASDWALALDTQSLHGSSTLLLTLRDAERYLRHDADGVRVRCTVLRTIADALSTRRRIAPHGATLNVYATWGEVLRRIERDALPSGSGFCFGTTIDDDASKDGCIVLHTSYHHMAEDGTYDGWTQHRVVVKPTFSGFDLRIGGRDRNGIKDYIADTLHTALSAPLPDSCTFLAARPPAVRVIAEVVQATK